jgi:PAS domain S-box-containing protein
MRDLILAKFLTTIMVTTKKRFHFSAQKKELEISPLPFTGSGIRFGWVGESATYDHTYAQKETAALPVRRPMHNACISNDWIMKNCPDIICTIDTRGRFMTVSDASIHITGYIPEEMEGKYFTDFIIVADTDKTLKAAAAARSGKPVSGFENRCYHKDGSVLPMLWSVSWSQQDHLLYCIGRDASDIKAVEADLQEGKQKYSSLFDHNPDAVYSLDLDGRFTSANEKTAEFIGCSKDEIPGMSFVSFVSPDSMELAAQNFKKAQNGEKISYDMVMQDMHSQKRHVNISNMPMIVNGQFKGIYGIAKDITGSEETKQELKRVNESLEMKIKERTCELELSIKEMEAFSYSVSHDLRAPLRIINGYSKLLSNEYLDKFDEDGKDFMAAIIENTKYMGRLIDDLLNLSRLGREAINTVNVDMTSLAQVVLHEMRMDDSTIGSNIKIHDLKPSICDQMLIRQVWINLISNAIKYSKKKENPQIEIGSYEKGNQTVYYIKDNGAGFDMKFAAKLFGVFIRLHDRSEFDGTGVGLALVHRIVTKHGGKVWANGKVDEGAVFYFSLPNS